jgi:alpha-L-glutamate ligase-like protein
MIRQFIRNVLGLGDHVLGINARNVELIYELNPRREFFAADDKLTTKAILTARGVPVPATHAVFKSHRDLADLEPRLDGMPNFVVKPAGGAGGRGIIPLRRDPACGFVRPGARGPEPFSIDQLRTHLSYILSGVFALERLADTAFFEELLEPDETLAALSAGGLPDIRVIVWRGRPVMAMLRLPTKRSGGRANLHQGALGLGIDLATGRSVAAIAGVRRIDRHPETGAALVGVAVPRWAEIVSIAVRAATSVGLGYVGADVAVDRRLGPVVLELNARPGLNVQLANGRGLRDALVSEMDAL